MSRGTGRPAETAPGGGQHVDRRAFFRVFGRSTVVAAGNVAGAADALRRGTGEAAGEMLGMVRNPGWGAGRLSAAQAPPAATDAGPGTARREMGPQRRAPGALTGPPGEGRDTFRSPYRFAGDTLELLDQRVLPGEIRSVPCSDGDDVARAIAEGVLVSGPVLGQVAAYGLALSSRRLREISAGDQGPRLRAVGAALVAARPSSRSVAAAVERLLARVQALDAGTAGVVVSGSLRGEADSIAGQAMLDHARLGRLGAEILPRPVGRPLQILIHGVTGPLAGGAVGTALAVVHAATAAGVGIHSWVTEGSPGMEGARLAAWELAHADIPVTVVPHSASAWLLSEGSVDVVLSGAEWVAADGDTANVLGTLPVALAAARFGVPCYVCCPTSTIDVATPGGRAISAEIRPGVADGPAAGSLESTRQAVPSCDVTPSAVITAFLTEDGAIRPPFTAAAP